MKGGKYRFQTAASDGTVPFGESYAFSSGRYRPDRRRVLLLPFLQLQPKTLAATIDERAAKIGSLSPRIRSRWPKAGPNEGVGEHKAKYRVCPTSVEWSRE